jgi:hypothetical protein
MESKPSFKELDRHSEKSVDNDTGKDFDKHSPKRVEKPVREKKSNDKIKKMPLLSIVNEMPSKYRKRSERLLHIVNAKGAPYIAWNGRGRLVYDGKIVSGSNIGELVLNLFSTKPVKSHAFKLFSKALNKIKLPTYIKKRLDGTLNNVAATSKSKDKHLQKKWIKY